ncbi:unnamed protein product [Leptidea sinapis]|uniref:Uncharacterized protein n=1 Tax=Leptidea sinapis TaxID=189913 RepID=A0A5E4QG91_9NEOP|nr:unnamed protein product [Leptidea sinapis]
MHCEQLDHLALRRVVVSLFVFYRIYHGECSEELFHLISAAEFHPRTTRHELGYHFHHHRDDDSLAYDAKEKADLLGSLSSNSTLADQVLRTCAPELAPVLTRLFRLSYSSGVVPKYPWFDPLGALVIPLVLFESMGCGILGVCEPAEWS